jgi:hypothetical protein
MGKRDWESDLTLILAGVFYEVMPPHQAAILADAAPSALHLKSQGPA